MAQKKIDIQFNLDSKSVKIAGEDTMKLSQQVRILKNELATGNYSQQEFEILATKLGDVEDKMKQTRARSGDLLTTLQLIPGPVGEIASKFNGALAVLKQFSGISLKDLQFQFKETIDDIKGIGQFLGKATGITAVYTRIQDALTASYIRQGVAADVAAAKARGLATAIATTGIGLLVVALGFAVSALIEYTTGTDAATDANERFEKSLKKANDAVVASTAQRARETKLKIAELKNEGAAEEEIRKVNLEKLKGDLKDITDQYVKAAADEEEIRITGLGDLDKQADATAAINQKRLDLINEIAVAEIDNETTKNNELKVVRQKADAEAKVAQAKKDADDERIRQDNLRKQKEAEGIQLEARLSLMSESDRAIEERTMRFESEKKKLAEAGYTDFTQLKAEFDKDIKEIDEKTKADELARIKTHQQEVRDARKADQEAFFSDTEKLYQEQRDRLALQMGSERDYVVQQKALLDQQQADLDFALERKLISQEDYNTAFADLTQQRIDIAQTEAQARMEFVRLIGESLGVAAQIAGENTKAGKALAIASTLISTYQAAQDAFASQMAIKTPDAPIRAALAAAVAVASGLVRVASIRKVDVPKGDQSRVDMKQAAEAQAPPPIQVVARRSQGGFVFGNGGSITDSIPAMLSDGEFVMNAKSSALFSPMLSAMNNMGNLPNTALPQAPGNQSLIEALQGTTNSRPVRTYVVGQDMSNQQQFDRTIKSRSLI
jgi:hypothetical protein